MNQRQELALLGQNTGFATRLGGIQLTDATTQVTARRLESHSATELYDTTYGHPIL